MRTKLLLLLLLPLLLSGCWDAEEVTKRTVVMACGLDQAEKGRIKVSVQLPIVEELLPIFGEAPVTLKPFSVLSTEAETVYAAIPVLQVKSQRSLFLGQLKALLISQELAEGGIKRAIDALHRHAKVPPQAFVFLTEDQAYEMLNHSFWHKQIPSEILIDYFHAQGKGDQTFPQQIWELSRNIYTKTQDAYLPLIRYDQAERAFIISGMGLFVQDRLVGKLTGEETRMFGLLSGRSKNAYLHLSVPGLGPITCRKVHAKPRIKIHWNGTEAVIAINLKAEGYLAEITEGHVHLKQEERELIDRTISAYLHGEMIKTLRKLQDLHSDPLAFGEVFRVHYPLEWEEVNWKRIYPAAKIELTVKYETKSYGEFR